MSTIVEKLLKRAERVTPPPKVLSALLDIVAEPNHQRADVARIVATDATLSGALLKLANSPAFARRSGNPFASIDQALAVLGEEEVVRLALGLGAKVMKEGATGYGLVEDQLWERALRTALAAEQIAVRADLQARAQCYCMGLFLDVGKLVMSAAVAKMHTPSVDSTFDGVERDRFGIDHAELGAQIVQRWKLPPAVVAAVRYHHRPAEAPAEHRAICFVAHLADSLATMTSGAAGIDGMGYAVDPNWVQHLPMTSNDTMELMFIITDKFESAARSLSA